MLNECIMFQYDLIITLIIMGFYMIPFGMHRKCMKDYRNV